MTTLDAAILSIIKSRTADNPIPLRHLSIEAAKSLELASIAERTVKRSVQRLRRSYGDPIASSRGRKPGYYYGLAGAAKLKAEGLSRLVTAHGMTASIGARENAGQERLGL